MDQSVLVDFQKMVSITVFVLCNDKYLLRFIARTNMYYLTHLYLNLLMLNIPEWSDIL